MAYVIGDDCIACGTCIDECPAGAISEGDKYSSVVSITKVWLLFHHHLGYSITLFANQQTLGCTIHLTTLQVEIADGIVGVHLGADALDASGCHLEFLCGTPC